MQALHWVIAKYRTPVGCVMNILPKMAVLKLGEIVVVGDRIGDEKLS